MLPPWAPSVYEVSAQRLPRLAPEPALPNDIPLRTESPPPPVEYSDHVEFKVAAILDSRVDRRRKDSGVLYLVQWLDSKYR